MSAQRIVDSMTRDGEIPAIFNPKRVRTPSVVVTGDSPNGPYGGFSNALNASNPQIAHQDSISSSQQDPSEVITIHPDARDASTPIGTHPGLRRGLGAGGGSFVSTCGVSGIVGVGPGGASGGTNEPDTPTMEAGPDGTEVRFRRLKACKESCCSELARKVSEFLFKYGTLKLALYIDPPCFCSDVLWCLCHHTRHRVVGRRNALHQISLPESQHIC